MRKTLLITLDFPPKIGGVSLYLEKLCARLPNDKIVVLAPKKQGSETFDTKQSYKIYRKKLITTFPIIWPQWFFLIFRALLLVKKENIEQILVGQILPVGTVAWILNLLFKIPYVVSTHALDITILKNSKRRTRLANNILKRAKKIITVSDFTKRELIKLGAPLEKTILISPATDIYQNNYPDKQDEIKKRYNLFNKKILLTIGRIVERKGHLTVLKSLPVILRRFPETIYLIGSAGLFETVLKNYVKENNLAASVIFTGEIPKEELPSFYQICDIFVMPSKELKNHDVEGFGIVYLEANSFGKPVIAARTGGVEDAVTDEDTGLLVSPDNSQELSQAIIRLLEDPDLAKRLGERGKERVLSRFSWEERAKKLEEVLL